VILQVFLNICERLQYKGFAFTRQRSLVRTQHRPLRNYLQNAVFRCSPFLPRLLVCSNPFSWLAGGWGLLGSQHHGRWISQPRLNPEHSPGVAIVVIKPGQNFPVA
jgi:hypothetical protein